MHLQCVHMYSAVLSCFIYLSVDMICISYLIKLLTNKPSIVRVHDNVHNFENKVISSLKSHSYHFMRSMTMTMCLIQGSAVGVRGTYHPPKAVTVSTE